MSHRHTIGIIGARGHVGAELIELIAGHPQLELAFVSSRELAGTPVRFRGDQRMGDRVGFGPLSENGGLKPTLFENLDPENCARRGAEVVVLALPNGMAEVFGRAIFELSPRSLVVDLSADYRFDDGWFYGLPELYRSKYAGQRRISNPGCYATAMQLAIAPMLDTLEGPTQCFGVSGYSGAGTLPSDRNDAVKLRDNLMPYTLIGHLHEREVTRHLGHEVEFLPHVAPHFRGITMTVNLHLRHAMKLATVRERYRTRYASESLVRVVDEAPWVSDIAGRHHVDIGGFALSADGHRLAAVATLDNLLKGAATQAMQNVNLALGLPELEGIPHD